MNALTRALRRWRNTRGFGVHSPFAYDLARNVIHPHRDYAYYGYKAIDRVCMKKRSASPEERNLAMMLLRLCVAVNPRRAAVDKEMPEIFRTALTAASPAMHIRTNAINATGCDFWLTTAVDSADSEAFTQFVATPSKTLVLLNADDALCLKLFDAMHEGVMIRGKRNLLIITRPQMRKIQYLMDI